MAKLEIRFLGGLQLSQDGAGLVDFRSVRGKALLCYLALTKHAHARSALAGLLWPESPEANARASLRQALIAIRKMAPSCLHTTRQTVAINAGAPLWIDVTNFETLLQAPTTIDQLQAAAALYQGEFLAGFFLPNAPPFDGWVLGQRARLRQLALETLQTLTGHFAARGELETAVAYARHALDIEPWREDGHRQLMRLLALSGQRAAALKQYQVCCELLADELGVPADRETTSLFERIRDGELSETQAADYIEQEGFAASPQPAPAVAGAAAPLTRWQDVRFDETHVVERASEMRWLQAQLEKAHAAAGTVVFIAGEAGSGKTTLLHEFARAAQADHPDLLVAGGRCDNYTGPREPLLPFRDVFHLLTGNLEHPGGSTLLNREHARRLQRALPLTIPAILDHGPHLVNTLVAGPALRSNISAVFPDSTQKRALLGRLMEIQARRLVTRESSFQQAQLFEEISTVLAAVARQRPLLLLLDDLHWADLSSLGLLARLSLRLRDSRILVLSSYRPEDLVAVGSAGTHAESAPHPLFDLLAESRRRFGENQIDLDQRRVNKALDFVNAVLDNEPNQLDAAFRRRLATLTDGHPLFVMELIRDMRERGFIVPDGAGRWIESEAIQWGQLPPRVEGVIGKRMSRLPSGLSEMLAVASVAGEPFSAELVAEVLGVEIFDVVSSLSVELGRRHRLIQEVGVQHAGAKRFSQYQFRHHLFQKYLYEQLGAAERVYLHEAVGEALEALYREVIREVETPAAKLARHFEIAGRVEKAGHYLLLAGKQAARVRAFGEAAAYFERGLALLAGTVDNDQALSLRFELHLLLAGAYWHSGRVPESLEGYLKAIEIARALGEPEALARAALGYEQPRWRLNLGAGQSQQFLEEALQDMDEENGLHLRLLVALSRTLLQTGKLNELQETVQQVVQIARRRQDSVALGDALRIQIHIDRRPEMTATRLESAAELIAIAHALGDKESEADGLGLLIYDRLELGQIALVDEAIATHRQLAGELGQPFQWHLALVFETMRAVMRGDWVQAEQRAQGAADVAQEMGITALDGIFGVHMFTIRREQGRLAEIAPILKSLATNKPAAATWGPGLALVYATLDQKQACRNIFEDLALASFATIQRDSLWVTSLAYLAEVVVYLQDLDRAGVLYDLLLPYKNRAIVAGGATICYGAAARYLGMIAAIQSAWETAEQHFETALKLDARMAAWPWLAHSRYAYARMLYARGHSADRQRAGTLLAGATEIAESRKMTFLSRNIDTLLLHRKRP